MNLGGTCPMSEVQRTVRLSWRDLQAVREQVGWGLAGAGGGGSMKPWGRHVSPTWAAGPGALSPGFCVVLQGLVIQETGRWDRP